MTLRLLAVAAVGALSASVASAEYFCETLPDQDTPHSFRTPLLNADQRTVFAGDVSYACNHSSGGVTYLQNLVYIFDYSANSTATQKVLGPLKNDTFRLDMNLSMAANGCRGALGVNVNFTILVRYPTKVWDALLEIPSLWPLPPAKPIIEQVEVVINTTTLDATSPVFSAASLICPDYAKGDLATCGKRNQNISNMLVQTGTNVELEMKEPKGSSKGPDGGSEDPPGLAFQLSSTFSILSSSASGLCAKDASQPFCCADPLLESGCCCTNSEMNPACHTDPPPFTSNMCSAATGKGKACSDLRLDPTDPLKKKKLSDCEIFKKGIYNFTSGVISTSPRVNVFPDLDSGISLATVHPELLGTLHNGRRALTEDSTEVVVTNPEREHPMLGGDMPSTGVESFDLLQYVFAELCSVSIGNRRDTKDCPGCPKGACWLMGDEAGVDGKGFAKIGDFKTCDSLWQGALRKLGWLGVVGIMLLISVIVAVGGFAGFKHWKKKQEQQAFGVSVNDDSIYKDVVSEAMDAKLAGSESDSVVR